MAKKRGAPAKPAVLSKESGELWRRLNRDYEFDDAQLVVLRETLEAMDRRRMATAQIKREGMTIVDRWGQVKVHPLASVERDSRSAVIQGCKALGLDLIPGA